MEFPEQIYKALSGAEHVAVLTGAGVSAESGIKTFRDPDGLWAKFNPAELASVDGFMANPNLVWEWYRHRVEIISSTKPNPGHFAIAEMQTIFKRFTMITQNVDRLHHAAGSKDVIELHGNILENHCFDCGMPFDGETNLPDYKIPKCNQCGGRIRPSVVWFGEMLPVDAIRQAEKAAENCDVFFTIGTSAEVYPAANLPIIAKRQGAYVIEINPNVTSISNYMDLSIRATSAVALPELLHQFSVYKMKGTQ